ncbi:uncharacterized protein N7483_000513 [Penicillium malachiteum]|uniref:uncharacterized protein n=1 Tax=Penicillium malachiteum TaxID=1324776 RepID=UPI0025483D2B|nr:uncharacterized protein N7483_000513 [Penicillium malachiteum]KAJ5735388.1 hypothetical protein N7483_000513 [Penicillium malachiteum]
MRRSVGITPDTSSLYSTQKMHPVGSTGPTGLPPVGRKRSQKACDMCYRKKTRCEVEGPGMICLQCIRRRTKCVFPSQQQHVVPPQEEKQEQLPSNDRYIESLKTRLERVESLLLAAGILHESDITQDTLSDDDDGNTSDDQWNTNERPGSSCRTSTHSESSEYYDAEQFPGVVMLRLLRSSNLMKATTPDILVCVPIPKKWLPITRRSCSLSILSRGGIDWIKRKTGDDGFLSILARDSIHDGPWNTWRPDVFHDLFASQVYKPLPPRSEVFSLIKDFFRTTNRMFPIFHEGSFMRMVEWQYTQQTCDDSALWASINMVICLAYEYRFSNNLKPEKDREKARFYFKNAVSVFTELALRRTDLLSVQALICMGFFLRGNAGTQAALPFMTAAMRSCQRMGLHRNINRPDLSHIQQEQRRRVFWITFVIDQSTCLRAGNAPSQHPEDFDVPLPQETEDDNDPEVSSNIPFFCQFCRMCVIKSRIYCQLYTAKALQKPPQELYKSVSELHTELETWKKDYPFTDVPSIRGAESDFLFGFASIALHFVYYNALIMIHRMPLLLNFLIASRENEPDDMKSYRKARASKSSAICAMAARNTLKLVNNMPWGDISWLWSLLYYVFLASSTLFSSILRNTRSASVKEDLQTLNMAAKFFAALVSNDEAANYSGFMARVTATLERIARIAVEREEKRPRSSDDEDDEVKIPGSKRQASRNVPASHSKLYQRRSSANQPASTSSYPTRPPHHSHTAAPSSKTTPLTTAPSNMAEASGFPETIEGFPRINSSGYVVPVCEDHPKHFSPPISARPPTQHTPQGPPVTQQTGLGLSNLNGANLNLNTMSDYASTGTTFPSWQLREDHTQTSSPHDNIQSPFSATSSGAGNTMFPDSWQVPLTADWQFGDELAWAGLFRGENLQAPLMPILNAESFLNGPFASQPESGLDNETAQPGGNDGNGYLGFASQPLGYNFMSGAPPQGGQGQDENQEGQEMDPTQAMFSNAFMGMF